MMGFFLKLRIILWKNLTLKIRSPFVLLFEVFIPLVLFVILLMIRRKQMPYPKDPSVFVAKPLPSAGVIPIMQVFCNGNGKNAEGLPHYHNSSLFEFLENLQRVAKEHNFFEPNFTPSDLDRLPELYKEIIEDPAAVHDVFMRAQDITVESVFVNQTELEGILERNFSLSKQDVDVLYNSRINFTAVYELLFQSSQYESPDVVTSHLPLSRLRRDIRFYSHEKRPDLNIQNLPDAVKNFTTNSMTQETVKQRKSDASREYDRGKTIVLSPSTRNRTKDVYDELLASSSAWMNSIDAPDNVVEAGLPDTNGLIYRIIASDPDLLFDPEVRDVIREITGFGGNSSVDPQELVDVMRKVLLSPTGLHYVTCRSDALPHILIPAQENGTQALEDIKATTCNMSREQWTALSKVLMHYSSTQAVITQLNLKDTNITVAGKHAREFKRNLELFIIFEEGISRLSRFASNLPQDQCPSNSHVVSNTTYNATDYDYDDVTGYNDTRFNPGRLGQHRISRRHTSEKHEHSKHRRSKYSGLLQVWMAMQNTLCGESIVTQHHIDRFSKSGKLGDLGFKHKELTDLGILIHVLYSNPRVLYAPNGTQADLVIQKANGTFALVNTISEYAKKWINASTEIRDFLSLEKTHQDLIDIRQLQMSLKSKPAFSAIIDDPDVLDFVENTTVFDASYLLHQLDVIDNAACSWLALVDGISLNVFKGFKTEAEVVEYFLKEAYHDSVTVFASVIFTNINKDGSLPPHVEYKIRQNSSFTQKTTMVRERFWFPGPLAWGYNYYQFGFTWIQDIIERALINVQVGHDVTEPGSWIHEMPYPCYMKDKFLFMIEHVMPLTLTISWVYTVAMLVQGIVYEKEQRLKEVMRMMGLSSTVHWLAWFITTFAQMSITSLTIALMFKFGHVLAHSNFWIIFLTLEVFVIATISFSFLMSACYSKAKLAAACAGIIYFISYVPYMYVAIREEAAFDRIPAWAKTIASMFSTTAFGLGAKYFAFYEIEGVGVQWNNIHKSPVEDDQYNLLYVVFMMLVDAGLYGLLTWYIENVHPGSYGLPKPWYFPFTYNYWCNQPIRTENQQCSIFDWFCRRSQGLSVMEEDQACALVDREDRASFETEPAHIPLGVCIDNLTKVYKNGKLAVNKLSLNLYEGQITSFLGHNGAGKTTTMSILTGLFPPTAGFATIYGSDIRANMDEIRRSLGMCPQHNVLFDKLTVEEHLWFYSRLKGQDESQISVETNHMIQDMKLEKKRQSTADCLSGGMQRKLSVAIAFVAGSRTVILDEPTAGVDPYARRQIWDLLIKYKQGRTILLSTHHMDEADILGDRIAIISNGQLKCCGSSLFLKSYFGEGYHLIIVKKPSEEDVVSRDTMEMEDEGACSFRTKCRAENVTQFISKYVSTSYLKSESSQELHYILPFEEAKKGHFEKLFQAMDSKLGELDISSYGVVDTSLEEVFLKVTEKASNAEEENAKNMEKEELEMQQEVTSHEDRGHVPSDASQRAEPAGESVAIDMDRSVAMDTHPVTRGAATHQRTGSHSGVSFASNLTGHGNTEVVTGRHGNTSRRGHKRSTSAGSHALATRRDAQLHARRHNDDSHIGLGRATNQQREQSRDPAVAARTHVRSPSDMSMKNVRTHHRTPSDISLRTLASIRGSYATHRRTGSDFSARNFKMGHQRSVSDAREPLLLSSSHPQLPGNAPQLETGSDLVPNFGTYARLENRDDQSLLSAEERAAEDQATSQRLRGCLLYQQQFIAIIVKRFFFIRRNWKQLFTQILLPAMFVCIAMTVALTAPQVKDLPAMILDPSQYYNYTQPEGNQMPYMNYGEEVPHGQAGASAQDLIDTFSLPSGVGATCILNSPYNSSFDEAILYQINHTRKSYTLVEQYFRPRCRDVFVHGMTLKNFVPEAGIPDVIATVSSNHSMGSLYSSRPNQTPRYYPICACAPDHTGFLCPLSGYSTPPHFQAVTSDVIQDITGNKEEEFYLYTTDKYRLHRYGGYGLGIAKHDVPPDFGRDGPTQFKKLAVRNVAKVRFNHKGYHSIPTYLNTLNNAILRANLPPEKGNPAAYGITLINHPMNNTNNELSLDKIEQGSDVLIAIFVIVAMSFVPASFVVFLVYERSIKAKHLQFVSGMNRIVYWVANYLWDMFNYMIPAACCILILKGFDIPAYVSTTNFPAVISLFLLYGWSITPMMYPASFVFNEPSAAYIAMIVANLFIGITCIITSFLLEMFQMNDPDLKSIHDVLKNIFLLFPNYCLGRGLMDIAFNEYRNEYFYKAGLYGQMQSPFEWEIMLRNLVAMATMGLIFFILTIFIEYNFFMKTGKVTVPRNSAASLDEDMDVANERRRVLRGSGKRDILRLENLTKVYVTRKLGRHLAVDRLCLGVPQGECFGLLGVNGAGKTTTFKMLTGDLEPSAGEAFLDGHSVLKDLGSVQEKIGYCPQFDALYDTLTAREHLHLYARLRGIPYKNQKQVVEWALKKLSLLPYADRQSGTYSGGNKRKLSTAVALIGHPPVIFLDEPTTGMDPHSRRFLWDLILDLIQSGRSVILTSHSMEECEALCTRLAIMVNSRFKCLGSIQHLKNKFGEGYTLSIRIKGPNYEREVFAVKRFVENNFPNACLKESHHNMVQYELPGNAVSLASLFSKMEDAQRDLSIEDYSISQNTLDNVFINFVKQQQEIVSETWVEPSAVGPAGGHGDAELQPFVTSQSNDIDVLDDDIATFQVDSASRARLQFVNMEVTNC